VPALKEFARDHVTKAARFQEEAARKETLQNTNQIFALIFNERMNFLFNDRFFLDVQNANKNDMKRKKYFATAIQIAQYTRTCNERSLGAVVKRFILN